MSLSHRERVKELNANLVGNWRVGCTAINFHPCPYGLREIGDMLLSHRIGFLAYPVAGDAAKNMTVPLWIREKIREQMPGEEIFSLSMKEDKEGKIFPEPVFARLPNDIEFDTPLVHIGRAYGIFEKNGEVVDEKKTNSFINEMLFRYCSEPCHDPDVLGLWATKYPELWGSPVTDEYPYLWDTGWLDCCDNWGGNYDTFSIARYLIGVSYRVEADLLSRMQSKEKEAYSGKVVLFNPMDIEDHRVFESNFQAEELKSSFEGWQLINLEAFVTMLQESKQTNTLGL